MEGKHSTIVSYVLPQRLEELLLKAADDVYTRTGFEIPIPLTDVRRFLHILTLPRLSDPSLPLCSYLLSLLYSLRRTWSL